MMTLKCEAAAAVVVVDDVVAFDPVGVGAIDWTHNLVPFEGIGHC